MKMKKSVLIGVCALAGGMMFAGDALEKGFVSPPDSAKPHTWYHMMNGNATKEGITCDFEAIARAGIGGVQMFDAGNAAGCTIPEGPLAFNSPEWFDLLKHAATEARRLGLEMCLPNCSGWSSSGGPWNMPSNGMKQVVVTETAVKGPVAFRGKLPRVKKDNGFYEDIAVLAFPTPPADLERFPGVEVDISGKTATISSGKPFTVHGVSFRTSCDRKGSRDVSARVKVEVSQDGKTFKRMETFSTHLVKRRAVDRSLRFRPFEKPVTARAIRFTFSASRPMKVVEMRPEAKMRISEITAKSFGERLDIRRDTTVATDAQVIRREGVIDLTSKLSPDGTLSWDAPAGDWTVMRFAYICNGRCNLPASRHGEGLEVDKLSASAMDYHFDQYVARISRHLGPLAGDVESGFNNILVDSWEVGMQNWTQGFAQTFERRTGYPILKWLPVLSGRVVDSVDASERFLEDYRRVIADLFAENCAGRLAELCHRHGLKLSVEPYGNGPFDNLQYGQDIDIPMAEFWSQAAAGDHFVNTGNAKFASYLAHVWGRRYAATESFTAHPKNGGRWLTTPFMLKALGDRAYADGVNRIIYHRFAHQPWPGNKYLPGMTMGQWGMHLDRTQTWWELAGDWFKYQTRCQWMLQEGTFVADVLFFCGEQAPNMGRTADDDSFKDAMSLPSGYDWDVCATKAMEMLKVEDGRVVVPGGVSYALLVLPPQETMSERMLETVGRLLDAGAKVCCLKKPTRSPGLVGYPAADGRVCALADKVWAKGVMTCKPAEALAKLGVAPDFTSTEMDPKTGARYTHRRNAEADWYFVALNNSGEKSFEASFRITGRQPEIWDAEKGTVVDAPQWRVEDGRTVVTLDFPPSGSAFVVFRRPATEPPASVSVRRLTAEPPVAVEGSWSITFPVDWYTGGTARRTVEFPKLASWTVHSDPDIRFFSGTATYAKRVPYAAPSAGVRTILDLGDVKNFAVVTVNGRTFPVLWRPPYRVDITDAVKGAALDIKIKVTNLWPNRLIGDDAMPADYELKDSATRKGKKTKSVLKEFPQWVKEGKRSPTGRHTFTTWRHWTKDDKLLPSGLLGPVVLRHTVLAGADAEDSGKQRRHGGMPPYQNRGVLQTPQL